MVIVVRVILSARTALDALLLNFGSILFGIAYSVVTCRGQDRDSNCTSSWSLLTFSKYLITSVGVSAEKKELLFLLSTSYYFVACNRRLSSLVTFESLTSTHKPQLQFL